MQSGQVVFVAFITQIVFPRLISGYVGEDYDLDVASRCDDCMVYRLQIALISDHISCLRLRKVMRELGTSVRRICARPFARSRQYRQHKDGIEDLLHFQSFDFMVLYLPVAGLTSLYKCTQTVLPGSIDPLSLAIRSMTFFLLKVRFGWSASIRTYSSFSLTVIIDHTGRQRTGRSSS
jgi:hypothetical protein